MVNLLFATIDISLAYPWEGSKERYLVAMYLTLTTLQAIYLLLP